MIGVSTSPFNLSMLRKRNTWYTVSSGNFSNPAIWISNGKKKHNYPQAGDDVIINHDVTVDLGFTTVNNLYVYGNLNFTSSYGTALAINGNLNATGTVDMSSTANCILRLNNSFNYINNFIPGSHSTVSYAAIWDQDIMDITYQNLALGGYGNKNVIAPLTVNGVTTFSPLLDNGTVTLLNKSSANKLTFIGAITWISLAGNIDNSVNADIEIRGGISWDYRFANVNLGSGNLYFNGTQSINIGGNSGYAGVGWNNFNTILIKGSSVVTFGPVSTPIIINGSIDGEISSSTLNVSGTLYQATNVAPMATNGVYNYNFGGTSIIGYTYNGNYTLPYGSYNGLVIAGTGTKTLGQNTTLTGQLQLATGTFELSSFNFTVNGVTNSSSGTFSKNSSSGSTVFKGMLGSAGVFGTANFNVSGTVIEFQNGFGYDMRSFVLNTRAGVTIKFTTNNQTIFFGGGVQVMNADVLISGAITVSYTSSLGWICNGVINGDNASSKLLINQTNASRGLTYNNAQQPMQTGIMDSSIASIFVYGLLSGQDITPGTYYNLTLNGSGAKKLLGNVSVTNTYTLTSPATLDSNSFALTNP
ncbi:hypothetical protein [Mucilaginibacter sp.]|uniref:hypothetical protein n=1 Tax=Mucilaginibacter sp. TaxID=1882438 RepID=UPI0026235D4C|nr:hypothetical protein [Mucilaginibacter sp.]MDB5030544.1 hypothetical protein [Mucilaginibacter sp.]